MLLVVAFHSQLGLATGGYLGVSTFFTLSGFLIATLVLVEHANTGGVDLRAFWRRRFRRLLPAAVVAVALVVVLVALFGDSSAKAAVGGDASGALLYVANWRLLVSGSSYAELFSSPSPLVHTWSLAVEEQFYLIFPVVVALLIGRRRRSRRLPLRFRLGVFAGTTIVLSALLPCPGRVRHRPRLLRHRQPSGGDRRGDPPRCGALPLGHAPPVGRSAGVEHSEVARLVVHGCPRDDGRCVGDAAGDVDGLAAGRFHPLRRRVGRARGCRGPLCRAGGSAAPHSPPRPARCDLLRRLPRPLAPPVADRSPYGVESRVAVRHRPGGEHRRRRGEPSPRREPHPAHRPGGGCPCGGCGSDRRGRRPPGLGARRTHRPATHHRFRVGGEHRQHI